MSHTQPRTLAVLPSSPSMISRLAAVGTLAASIAFAASPRVDAASTPIIFDVPSPLLDQWVYPFNVDPGNRFFASVFASQLADGFSPDFDNRDGQALVAFDSGAFVQAGLDPASYTVLSARLTMRVNNDLAFMYDPTPDSYTSWLQPEDRKFVPDADPGRPLEVFGVGFRNGFTALSYQENTPFSPVGPFGKHVRNAFPIASDSPRADLDVSNSVDERYDPTPMAIGLIAGLNAGDPVPIGSDVTFDLSVNDPDVQAYLQQSLADGRLFLLVASLFPAEQQGGGTFPSFYTKENPLVVFGFEEAGRLEMTVLIGNAPGLTGDLNDDGVVDGADLGLLLQSWGPCDDCAADLNGDGVVDGADLGILLQNWSVR